MIGEVESSAVKTFRVLGVPVAIHTTTEIIETVNAWIDMNDRVRLVAFTNVHMVVEASLRAEFRRLLEENDLNCPDGAPIFWLGKRKYGSQIEKTAGPDFMRLFCEQSASRGYRHFFYGGAPGVAEAACKALVKRHPSIRIAGHYSPPFKSLSDHEKKLIIATINDSKADVIWVCLGCPKQEQWMSDNKDFLNAKVVLAVGQAFAIVADILPRAPDLMIQLGLEWLYRLVSEPRRLWKRYLITNALFIYFLIRERFIVIDNTK